MRNIESFCPKSTSWLEVRDNWYPAYERNNKLWVEATISAISGYIDYSYTGEGLDRKCNEKRYNYGVNIMFWGADDFALEKSIGTNDFDEAVKIYRQFRKLIRKIKKMGTMDLQWFLHERGFARW